MGASAGERGVLKLVHPGRHVEIHREPISAAQILSKYPRHCIARPDVFKYPYIVVRPESILLPGKVFYLVPNRTLYNLLKARAKHRQPHSKENQSTRSHDSLVYTRRNTAIKCWGGKAPKHQLHDQGHRRRSRAVPPDTNNGCAQDSQDCGSDTSYIDAWTEIADKNRKVHNSSCQAHPADSSFDSSGSFSSKGYKYHGHNGTLTLSIDNKGYDFTSAHSTFRNDDMHNRISRDQTKLKSCFRKHDTVRKFLNLKVTFASPIIIPRISGAKHIINKDF